MVTMTLGIIFLAVALPLFIGVLIGCSLTQQALQARTRRQAAMQYELNTQWQELESYWRELEIAQQTILEQGKGKRNFSVRPPVMVARESATRR
jgi:hypothetical protein